MMWRRRITFALASLATTGLLPATAVAEEVCGTVAEFNAAMADAGTTSPSVRLTYDVVGVNPNDFPGTKGSLAQFRNTTCAGGADMGIKVYGPYDPPNDAHPTGTLKMEYGNSCCLGECGENWADPNASVPIFVDGTETCNVTMWVSPADAGYSLVCAHGTFDALGGNPEANEVNQIALLEFLLPDGGNTWEIVNATATNDQVCWESVPSDMMGITVPVLEDVATGPSWQNAVFPDITDLAVEADGTVAYLKFDVPPIEGKVSRVRLFMHVSTAPSSDGDGGEVHRVMSSDWSEATMTYATHPAFDAASLGRIGPGAAGVVLTLDLDTDVGAAGLQSLAVFSPPTDGNGTHFWSKEGSPDHAAYLDIDYVVMDVDGDGTPDGPDCNDADPAVGPGEEEQCNAIDDNCDGTVDEGCAGIDTSGGGGGGSDDSGGASEGSGSVGLDDGAALPGGGGRGADTGCGCTTRGSGSGWLALFGLVLVRPRRRASA